MSLQSKAQASHLGRDKCYSTLQQCYSFPMMRDRIQMYIKYCDPCQKQNTHKLEKCAHVLKPISIPQKCFSKFGLDLIGPLCESNQKKYNIYPALIISLNMLRLKLLRIKQGSQLLHLYISSSVGMGSLTSQ